MLMTTKIIEIKNFYKGKKILVLGSSGFIGKNLIKNLNKLDCKILATYNKNKPKIKTKKKIIYKKIDLLNSSTKITNKLFKNVDYVFMCAAVSSGAAVIEKKPLDHLSPNIIMNTRCLEAAYLSSVKKFCFISSSTVYPNLKKKINEHDVNFSFFDKYYIVGWMKLFSEIMCGMYSAKIKKTMQTLIVRPSNLYGPFDKFDPKLSKVIPSLIRKSLKSKKTLKVWGDGKDFKDFLYIDDFIDGLLIAFTKKDLKIVNISYGKSHSLRKIIKIIQKYVNKKLHIQYDKDMPSMIPYRTISNSLIKKKTTWKPIMSIESGLIKTIDWYKENYN
jgi:GDP-L-fucose synthase